MPTSKFCGDGAGSTSFFNYPYTRGFGQRDSLQDNQPLLGSQSVGIADSLRILSLQLPDVLGYLLLVPFHGDLRLLVTTATESCDGTHQDSVHRQTLPLLRATECLGTPEAIASNSTLAIAARISLEPIFSEMASMGSGTKLFATCPAKRTGGILESEDQMHGNFDRLDSRTPAISVSQRS
jgi:hypothetical protein